MPIKNEKELISSQRALSGLQKALFSVKTKYLAERPDLFMLLSEGPLEEIRILTQEIEEYSGVSQAEFYGATLWLCLVGEKAKWRETPISVLAAFMNSLRKGIQAIAAFNQRGHTFGRPPKEVMSACDFELVTIKPGSMQIGVSLPVVDQAELFISNYELSTSPPEKALGQYLDIANWAAQGAPFEELVESYPEAAQRRTILKAVRPIIPRSTGGIEFIEFTGQSVNKYGDIVLRQHVQEQIDFAIKLSVDESEETYVGNIREIDLDRLTFKLRNIFGSEASEITCHFPHELRSHARMNLGKKVRVIGTSTEKRSRLEITEIEPVSE
ncbi:MAG: hypothetical protein K9K86_04220 [Pseudomonadales bacterium]|nr:hypothetical protein [Pseudomonadales bacterium]